MTVAEANNTVDTINCPEIKLQTPATNKMAVEISLLR